MNLAQTRSKEPRRWTQIDGPKLHLAKPLIPDNTQLARFFDCDSFVLPSVHEPFGLVVAEILPAGVAITDTDQKGPGQGPPDPAAMLTLSGKF